MKNIVDDLMILVQGSSDLQKTTNNRPASPRHNPGTANHIFHQIASGGGKKTSTPNIKTSAVKEILFDEDFSDFNA